MIGTLRMIDTTPRRYFLKIFLPSIVLCAFLGVILYLLVSRFTQAPFVRFIPLFFPLIGVSYSLFYPHVKLDDRKREIDSRSHFFITAFGVLSISDVNRTWLLKTLSEKRELKYLAREIRKIHILVNEWNQSLAQASRFISKRTPSKRFADFLDRFAYSLDSGENMEKFLFTEQESMMDDYANYYRGALYDIDVFKEIYSSIVLSMAFLMSFIIIIPMLIGEDLLSLSVYVFFFFILVEAALVYFIKTASPYDPIWHSHDVMTKTDKKLLVSLVISIALCIVVGFSLYTFLKNGRFEFLQKIPFQIHVAAALSPLFIAGYVANKEENNVKRKDENFPGFIRSLGSSASARGGLILDSLYYLTAHDYGPLTDDIGRLHRRLDLNINAIKSWKLFSAEIGSNLIDVFSKMFVESVQLGADPGKVGSIISSNFNKIISLRKHKFQVTSGFTGIAYGLTLGIAFSIAISFSIAEVINNLYSGMDIQSEFVEGLLYTTSVDNLRYVSYIIFFILVVHSFFSAILIRIIDGGHYLNSLMNFTAMVWLSAIVVFVADKVVNTLIAV